MMLPFPANYLFVVPAYGLCVLLSAGLCSVTLRGDDPADNAQQLEFFEKQVRPLLVTHCYECHAGEKVKGGLSVESRRQMIQGGDTSEAIVPGDPDKSLLVEAVRYQNLDLQMPPKNRLSDSEIAILERWILDGALDPRSDDAAESMRSDAAVAAVGMSIQAGREFWSFRPVANPPIPNVSDPSWVRTPIDAFVLAKLDRDGLQRAPQADRRTLIRRVYFDLIGLPPTPQEIDSFVNEPSPDAYERLVERLLASPHYGIRWGRHWLDVARYADSNGLDENLAFGNAWRYRDYVVDAFNDDKPLDRFLVEQLAGDLLPQASRETKTATGFLVLGAKVLAEPDREKLEMDSIDEQLDATGKAFLGMTFGCVRCHDHKFDPIKQTDYYALAAIFKSTKTFGDSNTGAIKHWHEHSFATDPQRATLKEIDAKIADATAAASAFKTSTMSAIRDAARAKATEYLLAATRFEPTASLTEVAAIAGPLGLHPRILHHCRLHLHYHPDDPLLARWHQLSGSIEEIEQHYRGLFSKVQAALAKDPGLQKIEDEDLERARVALYDVSGFLAVPPVPEFAFDQQQYAEYDRLMEHARIIESDAPDEDAVMAVTDAEIKSSLPIHIRGSHLNFGDLVDREFPEVMRISTVRPIFSSNQSGRLQMAQWMASTQHPLTARVYVNRIWRWHFGTGIVKTTENFGVLGDPPSHPELLDWLARYLMQSSWSTKKLHRLILASSTYQMASRSSDPKAEGSDPENRWLWKFPIQRLDAEQIRDSILVVAGRLDLSPLGGKTIPLRNRQFVFNHTSVDHTKYDSLRRAIYLPVIRNNLYPFFSQFDFPDPTMPTGDRASTVVAPQSLLLMNSDLVIDAAEAFANELLVSTIDQSERIDLAYQRALGRHATADETARAIDFVQGLKKGSGPDSRNGPEGASHHWGLTPVSAEQHAWAMFCQSLFASNEFVYLR